MLPCLALLDVRYGGLVNAVFGGKGLALLSACETSLYLGNNIVGQNGVVPPAPGIFFLQLFKGRGTLPPKQMLPRATAGVVLHGYTSDAVLGADLINRHPSDVSAPDSQNRFIRLLRDWVGFATKMGRFPSSSLIHIRNIFLRVAKTKMGGVDALRVVAGVQDKTTGRNPTKSILIRQAVRQSFTDERTNGKHSVAFVVPVSCPLKTAAFRIVQNLGPETIIKHLTDMGVFPCKVKR